MVLRKAADIIEQLIHQQPLLINKLLTVLIIGIGYSQPLEYSKIKLLGAARQVSGSSYYIDTNTDDVLIDCGIFYPEDQDIDAGIDPAG